jgi:hypothetical protein
MYKSIAIAALKAIVIAVIINTGLFYMFHGMGIISDEITIPEQGPIQIQGIILSSVLPLAIATIVFMLLARFTKNANKIFMIIGVVIFLASLFNPMMIPGITNAMFVSLDIMHLVCFTSITYFLTGAYKNYNINRGA